VTKLWIFVGIAIFSMAAPWAIADEEAAPADYSKVSQDGQYIFVMFDLDKEWYSAYAKDPMLRKKYPQAGLYKNDDSSTPLWTVDWYSDSHGVYLSSDAKHLVRIGPWPRVWAAKDMEKGGPALKQPALAFYKEGKLLKSYTIDNLIKNPKEMPTSVSHFQWRDKISFGEIEKKLVVNTTDGQRYVFDVTSGEVVERTEDRTVLGKVNRLLQ